jgi:hypothetical protein
MVVDGSVMVSGTAVVAALLRLPELRLVDVDASLAASAARLAGGLRLRGADAV